MKKNTIAAIVLLLLMLDSGYFVERRDFIHLILVYSSAFAVYFYVLKTAKEKVDIDFWIKMALILRGVMLFSLPHFSEDIYRFIWDGRLTNMGINPFNFKPSYFVDNQLYSNILTPELFSKLNSKEYFTVYPSVCQGIFAFAVWLFPKSIYGSAIVIKFFLLASEIGTIFLLKKMLPDSKKILIYALNPLIIIELCANAHFEAAMIFFFLLSIFMLKKAFYQDENMLINPTIKTTPPLLPHSVRSDNLKFILSGIAFALSVASKMLPLMLLPFFIKRMGIKRSFVFFTIIGVSLLLIFIPLFNPLFINNLQSSLKLYFQKFEFNASVYYLIREVGTHLRGYNPINEISPILTNTVLIGFALIMIFEKVKKNEKRFNFNFKGGIFTTFLYAFSIYFLCATTVHPWYAAMPLVISIFTRFKYIVVWTALLPFTYIHYSYSQPTENYWVIGIEYAVVVCYFIYEIYKKSVFLINPYKY